ncbi:MAG: hypothetical protein L3J89_10160 [Gammaproteobacteria bacterium]|nr:hypothetical protein [Gammaproteobacteria bacterium]
MTQFNTKLMMLGPLLLAGSVNAAGPGFVSSTNNLSGCATGATQCTPPVSGVGFLQQEVTLNTNAYIQTVIIGPSTASTSTITNIDISTLAFSDLTFIQAMGSASGITSPQSITPPPNQSNVGIGGFIPAGTVGDEVIINSYRRRHIITI